MSPRVLLVTTCRWFATARLAMGLKNAGFLVEALCPSGHVLSRTSSVLRVHAYNALIPAASIRDALAAAQPDLIIPCDDLATAHLHSIDRSARQKEPAGNWITALVERSLGDPAGFAIAAARSSLMALAKARGIRVPATTIVENSSQVDSWLGEHGLPAVLKTDGTSGGVGVKIAGTPEEARCAFAALNVPPLGARVAKRTIVDRDANLLIPFLSRRRPKINIQSFIRGHDATSAIACWQGRVLAAIHFDVVHTCMAKGPASVVRLTENAEMAVAATKIVEELKLSGIYGFDFMVEEETGNAFLIEMNPRATQTSHLPLGPGRDLPAALYSVLAGERPHETKSVTGKKEIALFPQEWQRNPKSHFLSTAHHDVPWEEPELVRACLQSRRGRGVFSSAVLLEAYARMPWRR